MPLFDLLAGTNDGVFAVDRRQRIVFWNDGARRILGFEPDSVLGRACHEVLGGTDESGCAVCRKGCPTFLASLRTELSPTRNVQVHARNGGRQWINVSTFILPSRWHDLSLLAHVFRDSGQAKGASSRRDQAWGGAVTGGDVDGPPSPITPLTRTESTVLRLLARGATTATICTQLGVKTTTVRTHVQHIMEKLGVHTRLEAVAFAAQNALLVPPVS